MKWILLSEQIPSKETVSYRTVEEKTPFSIFDVANLNEVLIGEASVWFVTVGFRNGRLTKGYELSEIEWLDESVSTEDFLKRELAVALREATGAGMMDCKAALEDKSYDFKASLDYFLSGQFKKDRPLTMFDSFKSPNSDIE